MSQVIEKLNSKLLLFGEYTILLGGSALAMPFSGFNGHLDFLNGNQNTSQIKSHDVLNDFFEFLKNSKISKYFHLDNLEYDLSEGLYFFSTIPQSYGLGSSGALCAAIAKKYGVKEFIELPYVQLKELFSSMESFFHGKSSGIDPLVIYLNTPLLFEKDTIRKVEIQWEKIKSNKFSVFLMDTKMVADTAPLVKWFSTQVNEQGNVKILDEYVQRLERTIKVFLDFDSKSFINEIQNLSRLQLKLFHPMIPEGIKQIWEDGLRHDLYALKLCGSGGGGFFLGFSDMNKDELSSVLRNKTNKLTYIP